MQNVFSGYILLQHTEQEKHRNDTSNICHIRPKIAPVFSKEIDQKFGFVLMKMLLQIQLDQNSTETICTPKILSCASEIFSIIHWFDRLK